MSEYREKNNIYWTPDEISNEDFIKVYERASDFEKDFIRATLIIAGIDVDKILPKVDGE